MIPPIDFAIITPLEEERLAVLAHLGPTERLPPTGDDIRVYYATTVPVTAKGRIRCEYKMIVTDLVAMGRVEAASAVSDVIRQWRPRYLLVVGIAGGVKEAGVDIGDVLVSDQIVDYALQKLTPGRTENR